MNAIRFGLAVLAVGLLAGGAVAAEPPKAEGVKEVAAELAANVKAVLQKRSQLGIRVGIFTGSGIDHAQAGGMLMAAVTHELGSLVNVEAKLELKGDYSLIDDPKASGLKVIAVTAYIKDLTTSKNVKDFPEFEGYVRNATDFARMTGATVAFKPVEDDPLTPSQRRIQQVQTTLPTTPMKPPATSTAFVKGSVVRSHEASHYDVEVLCGPKADGPFAPLQPTLTDPQFPGLPFVDIAKGHYYQVKVTNRDPKARLGVFLHLDGIDQFTFSEDRAKDGSPKYRMWVVEPGQDVVIRGYHKNVTPGEVFGFLTTEHGKGAASKFPTLSQGKVGTICVGLAREKQPGEKGGVETVPGDVIPVKQKVTEFKLGEVNEFVTVRYSR